MTVSTKAIPDELLDALMSNYQKPEDLIGANGLLKPSRSGCAIALPDILPSIVT